MHRKSIGAGAVLLLAALTTLIAPLHGQNFYGSVVGTVSDASGATIAGGRVSIVNGATGERRAVVTDSDGGYRFPNLLPGNYKIEVSQVGFKLYLRDNVTVQVESSVRIDVAMEVGDVTQQIEVSAAAPLLQTENASLSQVVGTRSVQELPLNGRNILNLVNLVPGVVPQGSSDGNLTGKNVFAAGNYQIGGGTANQSVTLFDGVPVNITYGNVTALVPVPDAVSEFRVQTNNNSAEYGRYTGGVINVASRSGSNDFHGGAYEYLRNRSLNATNFFANRSGAGKAPFVQNQFGANLGGRIIRDKLFFYGGYEGFRARQGNLFSYTVPLPEQRTGDFRGYLNSAGQQIVIYDPNTQCGAYGNPACGSVQRTPFPNNVIPANRISPAAAKLVAFPYHALPTDNGQAFTHNLNFNRNAATGGDNDQLNLRGDYQMNEKQRLLARYTRWSSSNQPVDPYSNGLRAGDPFSPEHFVTTQAVLADTYVLRPNMILDVRAGFTRWFYNRIPGTFGQNGTAVGLPSYFNQIATLNGLGGSTTIPQINISSPTINQVSTGYLLGVDNTYTLSPTFNWIKGKHSLKFGGEFHRYTLGYFQNNAAGGVFGFDNLFTAATSTGGASGSGYASFLLGLSNNTSLIQTSWLTYTMMDYEGFFVTDTFQATKKLSITAGLRYEIPGVYKERFDRIATFNRYEENSALKGILVNGKPVLGAYDPVNTPNHPYRGQTAENYGLLAPRVGIAYRLDDKTVIRTGGGIFFIPGNVQFTQGPQANPLSFYVNSQAASIDSFVTYSTTFDNPFPSGLSGPPGRTGDYQSAFLGSSLGGKAFQAAEKSGFTAQWNFSIQHQFNGNFSLDVSYAGLRGIHLPANLQYDQIDPQYLPLGANLKTQVANPFYGKVANGTLSAKTVQAGQLLLPFPQYTSVSNSSAYLGDSTYHALQVKAEKRFSTGGTLLASYTFSKVLSNVETLTTWLDSGTGVAGYQNNYDLRNEKALSSFDSRQRLTVSYVYDLPFGKGRQYLSSTNAFVSRVISGWGINGVTTYQMGFPLGMTATPNNTGLNTGLRPNVVPGCQKTVSGSSQSKILGWFNTSCFTAPAIYTFGSESRTDPELRGPGIRNYDFAMFKRTAITERFNLEFRAEAFNLFNRVQFGTPDRGQTTSANNTFGQITSQQNNPRLLQMALRLRF